MAAAADTRVLGLSPKARRFVLPLLALAVVVVIVGSITSAGVRTATEAGQQLAATFTLWGSSATACSSEATVAPASALPPAAGRRSTASMTRM
jgi:hypothetical protein